MANGWTGGQYSLFRALLGIYLFAGFVHAISDTSWPVRAMLSAAAVAALLFVVGWRDRLAAFLMWLALASIFVRDPLAANPGTAGVGVLLLAHLFVPAAPYGSAAARDRIDPDGGWVLPRPVFLAGRAMLALSWVWLATLVMAHGFLLPLDFTDLTLGMLFLHLFAFNPAWIPARRFARGEVLYYDGTCAMCHGFVRFLLAEERSGTLRYAPLQSAAFAASVPEQVRASLPDSLVLRTQDGRLYLRSDAVVQVMGSMGGLWFALATLLRFVPRRLRDLAYDAVGGMRYRLFGRTTEACPLMPPHLRARMLVD